MEATLIAKNAKRLRYGLELTQAEVAKKSGISVPTYSNIESGKSSPRMDTLFRIASTFDVGIHELLSPVRELRAVRFRANKKMKKRDHILATVARWLDDFNYLLSTSSSSAEFTLSEIPSKLRSLPLENRPKLAAKLAREQMKLDDKEPIHDVSGLLAANGIKLLTYPLKSHDFFGLSIGQAEGGPGIVVNTWDRIKVERWIFSAAHELGHLLLHLGSYDVDTYEENNVEEKEADCFASYFLIPQSGFRREWTDSHGLSLWDRILKIKRIYHVSYKTVIYRLLDLGILYKEDVWKKANTFLKRHYKKRRITKDFEPEELRKYDFVTDWLDRLVRIALEERIITQNRASEILDISLQDMRNRMKSWTEERVGSGPSSSVHC